MNQDEIIEMAKQAGGLANGAGAIFGPETLIAFAKLVAAKEREACAELCDEESKKWKSPKYHYATAAAEHCSKSIRERGQA